MKKEVMKRAWEIYRTLEGDRNAKLSQALKQAWAEVKTVDSEIVLPELIGSEKQVAWAEKIRKNYVEAMYKFVKSDEKFFYNGYGNAFSVAGDIYRRGITQSNAFISMQENLWREARKNHGLKGKEVDAYEHEKSPYREYKRSDLKGKTQLERMQYDKNFLKKIFEETLKIDVRASDWIEAFKYGSYDK